MKRSLTLGYFIITAVLALALMGFSEGASGELPRMGFTDTPTPTNTPEPRETLTPTATPGPGPQETPTPIELTPVGTLTLPETGQVDPVPLWLLFAVVGGLLMLGARLLRRSSRLF